MIRVILSVSVIALVGTVLAQEPATPPKPAPAPGATTAIRIDNGNQFLASCLLIDNENEIAISQLAETKSQNQEVKAFAQKMITEHRQFADKLRSQAPSLAYSPKETGDRPREVRATDPRQPSATDPYARGTGTGSIDVIALKQELARACLDTIRKEFEQKQGADFDRCFMGFQVMAHMKTNDELTVFQRHATDPLKGLLAECQKSVQSHLDEAKSLAKKLDGHDHGEKK